MFAQYHPEEHGETTVFIGKNVSFISLVTEETLQMISGPDERLKIFTIIIERKSMPEAPFDTHWKTWMALGSNGGHFSTRAQDELEPDRALRCRR